MGGLEAGPDAEGCLDGQGMAASSSSLCDKVLTRGGIPEDLADDKTEVEEGKGGRDVDEIERAPGVEMTAGPLLASGRRPRRNRLATEPASRWARDTRAQEHRSNGGSSSAVLKASPGEIPVLGEGRGSGLDFLGRGRQEAELRWKVSGEGLT